MPGQDELLDALNRSSQVVQIELDLLDQWRVDPNMTPGRRAEIDLAANYIGVGFSCALRRTAHAFNEANALPDTAIRHAPGDQHQAAVQATVDSIANRAEWPGPQLSDASFTNAIMMARNNSDQCADNAETIFTDCVHPEPDPAAAGQTIPPSPLVAVPAPLKNGFAELAPAKAPAAKKPPGKGKGK